MINSKIKSIKLKKGKHIIKIGISLNKKKEYSFAYTLKEHRQYKCNTTPKLVRTIAKLEAKGYKEV